MAENKKRKLNPSSRYSRMEEPWLDERGGNAQPSAPKGVEEESYGVSDSYFRQSSYGRPDGYYDQGRTDGSYDAGYSSSRLDDTRVYSIPTQRAAREDAGRTGMRGNEEPSSYEDVVAGREMQRTRRRDQKQRESDRNASYDVWDDPEYDDRYETPGKDARRGKERRSKDAPAGEAQGRRGLGKGFFVKLILLILAAAALAAVWRFTRVDHLSLKDILTNAGVSAQDGYKDFVIYGVDSREGSLTRDTHSDSIIICSMNQSSKEIRLVSVYRDTYLDNTNGEFRKATECYFFGGPERSVNMLNKNLDLSIRDYVTLDFSAVVQLVDLVGGVDVDVTEEELPYINGYQTENAQVTGAEITPVTQAGYQHLNGIQALAYCRIRYTAGSDYKRTERQRTVLAQVFQNAKSQGAVRMAQVVNALIPNISTSFSNTELLAMAAGISDYSLSETCGFPFDQIPANISAGDCVVPVNLAANVAQLHTFLYGQTDYTPSAAVQEISTQIAQETGIY